MHLALLVFTLQTLGQYVLAYDLHCIHHSETPYSTILYFSPVACCSRCGDLCLMTTGYWLKLVVFLRQIAQLIQANMMPFVVSEEDFRTFHTIDRELYAVLVMNLWRDPVEALQVMALWIWLERSGFRHAVKKILSLPNILINELADEAITCLNCIHSDRFAFVSENNDILMTQNLMEKEISLKYIYDNRLRATLGVAKVVNEVCIKSLTDIMQQAIQRNAAQSLADSQRMMAQSFQAPLFPTAVGVAQQMVHPLTEETEIPPDGRTMFVTFSKGYPVLEKEVRDFFTTSYGDGIESLHMQEAPPGEQALFARIVFRSPSTMDVVLDGAAKAKFTINGKHVWVRKFVPKWPRTITLPCAPARGS